MLRGRRARRRRRKDDDDEDEESAEQGGDAAVGGNACPDGLRVRHGALARSSESEREGGQGQPGRRARPTGASVPRGRCMPDRREFAVARLDVRSTRNGGETGGDAARTPGPGQPEAECPPAGGMRHSAELRPKCSSPSAHWPQQRAGARRARNSARERESSIDIALAVGARSSRLPSFLRTQLSLAKRRAAHARVRTKDERASNLRRHGRARQRRKRRAKRSRSHAVSSDFALQQAMEVQRPIAVKSVMRDCTQPHADVSREGGTADGVDSGRRSRSGAPDISNVELNLGTHTVPTTEVAAGRLRRSRGVRGWRGSLESPAKEWTTTVDGGGFTARARRSVLVLKSAKAPREGQPRCEARSGSEDA